MESNRVDSINFCSKYANKYNLISHSIEGNFLFTEEKLSKTCPANDFQKILSKPNLKDNSQLKKYLRNGIPNTHIPSFLKKYFEVKPSAKEDYKIRQYSVFKNTDINSIVSNCDTPTHCKSNKINDYIADTFLTEEGKFKLKELMWLIHYSMSKAEYCPLILQTASLLLVYLTEEETFSIINTLILTDSELNNDTSVKFRFALTYEENRKMSISFIKSFELVGKAVSKAIIQWSDQIKLNLESLVNDMFMSLFSGYLNFQVLSRVFILYLKEGCKILYRAAYSILKLRKDELLKISDPQLVKTFLLDNTEYDIIEFLKTMFSYGLTRNNNLYTSSVVPSRLLEEFRNSKPSFKFYIPVINEGTDILENHEVLKLWNFFESCAETDAKRIFWSKTQSHVLSLRNLYDITESPEYLAKKFLGVIKTSRNDVFGFYTTQTLDSSFSGVMTTPKECCLFVLRPFEKVFNLSLNSKHFDCIVHCDKTCLAFGEVKHRGFSLKLAFDMKSGVSIANAVLEDLRLNNSDQDEEFIVEAFEVFVLN